MAIQSALTGHLVFSTLHTNDSASAVARLLDLGVEPYLVASSLVGVLAQRLVRKVCGACGNRRAPSAEEIAWAAVGARAGAGERAEAEGPGPETSTTWARGPGCVACRNSGYRGRVGMFELLEADDALRAHVQRRSAAAVIRGVAIRGGMRTLREDGVRKVLRGLTTVEEVERVTMRDRESAVETAVPRDGEEPTARCAAGNDAEA
jgi:type II secretory ATPase GspE/PulE/Tfp pilus assembly ATPase PilB-like protein